jgi:hypothetical protein
VDPAALDVAGISVLTAPRNPDSPRSGAIYDPLTWAAAAPVWVHPMVDGRFLVITRMRWHAAVPDSVNLGAYSAYSEDTSPCWMIVEPTGRRSIVPNAPVQLPLTTKVDSAQTVGGASRPPNYLYLLHDVVIGGNPSAVLQHFHLNPNGAVTLAGEEVLPVVDSPPVVEPFTVLDTAKWDLINGVVEGGYYNLPPTDTSYQGLISKFTTNLTGHYVAVELVSPSNTGTWTMFYLGDTGTPVSNAEAFLWMDGVLYFRERIAGTWSNTTIPYDATNHRWLRVREQAGTVYWETSSDGSIWTVQRSKAAGIDLSNLYIGIAGSRNTTDPPGTALWDNIGIGTGSVVFNRGVQYDTPFLVLYGSDPDGKVYRIRKPWGRVGHNRQMLPSPQIHALVVGTQEGWEYYTGTGYSQAPDQLAPVGGLSTVGPMSFASWRAQRIATTVSMVGGTPSGVFWSSSSGRPFAQLGLPVSLGTVGYLGGGIQLMSQLQAAAPDGAVPADTLNNRWSLLTLG